MKNGIYIYIYIYELGAKQVEGLAMKVKEADWDTVMKAMDTNKNGFLDYTEFIAAALHSKQQMKEVYLKEAFEHFDKVYHDNISIRIIMDKLV